MAEQLFGFMDGSQYDVTGKQITAPTTTTVATPVAPPPVAASPSTTTSDAYRTGTLAPLQDAIKKLAGTNPLIPTTTVGGENLTEQQFIEKQRSLLELRREQEVKRLQAEFDIAEKNQKQAQKSETGTSSTSLARIGGFDSASGQAVLTNLARVHEQEQQALMGKRQAAIAQAQNAFQDKDFALAQLQLNAAKEAEKTIYERQKDFVNYSLDLYREQRADLAQQADMAKFEYQKQRDLREDQTVARDFAFKHQLKTPFYVVGGIGYDTGTGEPLSYEEYIKRGGDPDFKSNVTVIDAGSELEREFVINLANKYVDAPIDINKDSAATARAKIEQSRIYREQVRPPQGKTPPGAKQPSIGTVNKYDLPSNVTLDQFNQVKDYLLEAKRDLLTDQNMSDEKRYELWDAAAQQVQGEFGLNPSDFDALFWETFHKDKLDGYNATYRKGQEDTADTEAQFNQVLQLLLEANAQNQ